MLKIGAESFKIGYVLSVLEIWPKELSSRSSRVLRKNAGVILMVFSSDIALFPILRLLDVLNDLDLAWMWTLPKYPWYQTECVSLLLARRVSLCVELCFGNVSYRDFDWMGLARGGCSMVVACKSLGLKTLMECILSHD